MKKNKLIAISLVAVIAIYGTYKVVFADNSEQKLVEKVNDRIQEQNISVDSNEDKNSSKIKAIVKKVLKKKTVKKINMDEISLEPEEFDDSNCSNPVYIPDADEICENDYEYTLISDGTAEGRKKAMAQKAIEIRKDAFGGKTPFDNPEIGERVCKVVLAEQLYRKSGQGDIYNIFFCNNKEQVSGSMMMRSGGIDSDGIEHTVPGTYQPFSPSITASSTPNITFEQEKLRTQFDAKKELPRDIKESEKIILNSIGKDSKVVATRLVTRTPYVNAYSLHEFTIKNSNEDTEKYYIGAFTGNIIFTEEEMKLLQKHSKASQKIISDLSSEEWAKLEYSGKLSAYIDERIDYTDKEKKYYSELDKYYESLNPIKEEK